MILVSGFGDDGRGGLYAIDGGRTQLVDRTQYTGLYWRDGRLLRLTRAPGEYTGTARLVDDADVQVLPGVRDPHDVLAANAGVLVVSTGTNTILRDGYVLWQGPDVPDACHVNCVTEADDDVWASAFGWFQSFKGWRGRRAVGTGVLWNLRTGEEIGGLSHPHTPRFVDGSWLLCESILGAFVQRDRKGIEQRRIDLGGYTRGFAAVDDHWLVGVSARRTPGGGDAHVAVIDPVNFAEIDRIALPCSEVYDIITAPIDHVPAIALDDPVPPGRVLAPGECACRITANLLEVYDAGEALAFDVDVHNTGTATLASRRDLPVFVAARWLTPHGTQIDGDRVPLPEVLPPGARTTVRVPIEAPEPGSYRLQIGIVQEGQFWFDDLDPACAAGIDCRVTSQ
ncbi:MAG TPA: DUF4915 domain-containing protein [Acidimicrobiia bacterium]|nr:DUF4915 domain-containing protein [Acidimicrobiia bacterium]